jgi:hypothetical protein
MQRVCFSALIISNDCHVTIGIAKDATEHESRMMQQDLERKIRSQLPIRVEIGNFKLRGSDNTIPTYDIIIPDTSVDTLLKRYYRAYFKGDPSKRQFPILEPHVTVDTPEKLQYIESLINGPQKGCIEISDTTFQVRNDGGEAIFNQETWKCNSCQQSNPINQKECGTVGCAQWRPQQAMPRRPGDWDCCGEVVFASRSSCFKCGKAKDAPSAPSIYEIPPPRPKKIRLPDWYCCGEMVFGSKTNCYKCGHPRK